MLLRTLLSQVARRAAADPRVRAKAAEVYQEKARPVIDRKLAAVRDEAARTDARESPAFLAGRIVRRLIDD